MKAQFRIDIFTNMATSITRWSGSALAKANNGKFILFLLPCLLILTSFMPFYGDGGGEGKASELGVDVVVIDAGHGGKDPGAIGPHVQEKKVVLDVALKLGGYIEENFPEVKVVYTRKKDEFVELYERAKIANRNSADLFISIHANVAGSHAAKGCETFVLGLHRSKANLEVAKKENSAILMEDDYKSHYENFDPRDPDSYIALELMQSEHLEQSLTYASYTQDQFRKRAGRKDRGVKQAGFLVLYKTTMPSVLTELGFLSNPNEERFLMSDDGQSYMASAMFRSFREYKKHIESVNGETLAAEREQLEQRKKEAQEAKARAEKAKRGKNISFRVQIAASSDAVPLKPENFKGLSNVDEYISDGVHKYTVGDASEYGEAQKLQKKVREKGYSNAFIVAFREGERIDLQQALTLLKKQ